MIYNNKKNLLTVQIIAKFHKYLDSTNSIFAFYSNITYIFFFIYFLISASGLLFQINSNFILFFTFTSFLLFFYYFYNNYFFFFSTTSISFNILNNLLDLINFNVISLYFLKQAILNNNLIFFKNLFIYVKSFNILTFINSIIPMDINLNIYNFILSNNKIFEEEDEIVN